MQYSLFRNKLLHSPSYFNQIVNCVSAFLTFEACIKSCNWHSQQNIYQSTTHPSKSPSVCQPEHPLQPQWTHSTIFPCRNEKKNNILRQVRENIFKYVYKQIWKFSRIPCMNIFNVVKKHKMPSSSLHMNNVNNVNTCTLLILFLIPWVQWCN